MKQVLLLLLLIHSACCFVTTSPLSNAVINSGERSSIKCLGMQELKIVKAAINYFESRNMYLGNFLIIAGKKAINNRQSSNKYRLCSNKKWVV